MRILAAVAAAAVPFAIALASWGDEDVAGEPVVIAAPRTPHQESEPTPAIFSPAPAMPALVLHGVSLGGAGGGGAILGLPNTGQRGVAVGREFLPGIRLKAVSPGHAVIEGPGGEIMLALPGEQSLDPGTVAPVTAAGNSTLAEATLDYRLGMKPVSIGGAPGYEIRPEAKLADLERAGLRAGDIILGVNGSRLDEERLLELAWEIENSDRVEFDYLRGGVRARASIQKF